MPRGTRRRRLLSVDVPSQGSARGRTYAVARRVPQEKQTNSRPAPGPSPSSSIINHGERNHQGLGNAFVFLDTTVSDFFCKGIRTHHQQQTAQAPAQDGNAARLAPAPSSTTYRPSRTVLGESRTCYYPAKPGRIVRGRGMGQGYVLVSHSGTHLFHRIEATQSKARRQIVSDMTPEEILNRAIAGSIFCGAHANVEAYPRDDGPRSYRVHAGQGICGCS